LVYTEIETHIKPDGGEVNCRVPFSITSDHVCKEERGGAASGGGAAAPSAVGADGVYQVLDVEVSKLVSHAGEVFACQWNPKHPNILATGASDATAVLWSIPRGKSCAAAGKAASDNKKVLPHAPLSSPSRDVTTLEWSPDGTLLATGSYDGTARLWTLGGTSAGMLTGHSGPIFSLRWTTDAKYILSGGVDRRFGFEFACFFFC
jgi:transducin (beta)-like 1